MWSSLFLLCAQGSIFPAEINKVGTEETIAPLSPGAALIHSSSPSLMDHGSLQEHTKTDRALFTLPASPSQALHNKRHIHGQKPYIFSLYVQSLEIIFIKHVRLVVFEGKNVNQMAAVLLRVDSDSPKSHRVSNKQTDQGSSRPATPVLN